MPNFSISVDTFQITDTRSVHTDTNHGSISFRVVDEFDNEGTSYNFPEYGNYNNGTYAGNLVCAPLTVNPNIPLTFNYLILNAGFTNPTSAHSVLQDVGTQMVQSSSYPAFASCLQQVATQYAATFNTILRPGCDGLVAAEQNTFTFAELLSRTAGTPATFRQSTTHIGPTIAHSCNPRPSHYIVNWSLSQVVAVPDVNGMTGNQAAATLKAVNLLPPTSFGNGYVSSQVPAAGSLAPLRSTVRLSFGGIR